ncbi:hypothetical protein GYMLUDRAFT_151680 [Collybiopsis luxurians FD-317 M1]|nr:hypothetical protein GYMLUDRAFT_151680 [Collybiopsis luxurians FD-317 M1]
MAPPIVRFISSSSVATTSASKLDDPVPQHGHRRIFVGPMPQKVLPIPEELKKRNKRKHIFPGIHSSDSEDEQIRRIINHYARSFFLQESGGREEDSNWGENEEQSTREEMYRRWNESEWGVALRRLRGRSDSDVNKNATNSWIGGSFEIGTIAGLNIIAEEETLSRISSRNSAQPPAPFFPLDTFSEQQTQQTFVTAPTEPSESAKSQSVSPPNPSSNNDLLLPANENPVSRAASSTSSTPLLRPSVSLQPDSGPSQTQSEPSRHPIMKLPNLPSLSSAGNSPNKSKKTVHYALSPVESDSSLPAPPTEVLERTGTDVSGTSAGAMSISAAEDPKLLGDVAMRDRMYVRAYSTDRVDVFTSFDESVHRVTRNLKFEGRGEFLVVWRKDYLEIYENYTIGMKEWITHHKYLAFIIPLKGSRTRLFLYSFVDLTFCITCSPTSRRFNPVKAKWNIHSSKEGSNIFIFNVKSRTRAFDWIWRLWRFRSGVLPPVVEIRVPRLDNKLKIEMPNVDSIQTYKIFSNENLISLSMHSLRAVPDWKFVIERQLAAGNSLHLCWRDSSYIDWVWLHDDTEGRPRDWAVLCGLALKQSNAPVHLELRMAEHRTTFVLQRDGSRLYEPPAIEGYVDRIKPNSQTKQPLYLVTHEGNLFVLNTSNPHPPMPLGAAHELMGPDVNYAQELQKSEVQRGIRQLLDATGVMDLRSIMAVRRAKHPVMQGAHDHTEEEEEHLLEVVEEASQSDREDAGGEEVLNKSADKRQLKMKRSLELLLTNGHVLRFETYSCLVTLEWIERLQALVRYWKLKHRNDAKEEMELAQAFRPLVTPHTYAEVERTPYAESPVDLSSPLPALGSMFNWCVLEGCKPIIKSGKVFMKRGLHSQYGLMDLVLLPESLIHFRITPKSVLHSSVRKKIYLADAYVCSGYLAAQLLPSGQFNPNADNVPRRYQDGLETDDPEEDRLFVILYRNKPVASEGASSSTPAAGAKTKIPPLNAKRKIAIFRTRSRLERDAWCWALKSSIEKAVRARKERERKMRESGGLMNL